ncbi:MAG: hypothetical protein KDJ55_10560 [Rhodobiaceae bacterium]|nr:hypothetical protein [Rhodobiaceae bacterium]MCC0018752.1 hypothetical protein [Rhodobiaceae bacterium]MCC0061303.1 hypothetical protein [Rhodobiaceae bacterium]
MFSALQDSFRWTNDVVSEVVTGVGNSSHAARRAKAYVWRPAVDIRDGSTVCTLTTFAY